MGVLGKPGRLVGRLSEIREREQSLIDSQAALGTGLIPHNTGYSAPCT